MLHNLLNVVIKVTTCLLNNAWRGYAISRTIDILQTYYDLSDCARHKWIYLTNIV